MYIFEENILCLKIRLYWKTVVINWTIGKAIKRVSGYFARCSDTLI